MKSIKLAKEDFLNLISTSAEKLKNGTFAEKDAIARAWLLNLRIGPEKEVFYLCKTELKDLVNFNNVKCGGPKRTLLKPPKQVAKVLYTQCSKKDFYIPKFCIEEAKELLSDIEYVL